MRLTEAELEEGLRLAKKSRLPWSVRGVVRGVWDVRGGCADSWYHEDFIVWAANHVKPLISELRERDKRIVELEAEIRELSVELQRWQGMARAGGNEITRIVDLRGI